MVTKRKADRTFAQTQKYNEYMRKYMKKKSEKNRQAQADNSRRIDDMQPSQEALDVLAQAAARIKSRPT